MKKAVLDATDVSSYRPISNLSVLSKLLERLVARQLMQNICHLPTSYRHCSPAFDQAIQLKPPSRDCEYFPTYYRLSTAVIQLR